MADFFEKGLPPLAGGTLDQTTSFLEACRIYWSERAEIEAKDLERYMDRN